MKIDFTTCLLYTSDAADEGLGREPNLTELGIFSAMWNEHCSYKSSKFWLKKLPTSGERVLSLIHI